MDEVSRIQDEKFGFTWDPTNIILSSLDIVVPNHKSIRTCAVAHKGCVCLVVAIHKGCLCLVALHKGYLCLVAIHMHLFWLVTLV